MKKTIRLSESDLHRMIKESVKRALSEGEAWANQPPIDEFHPDWWYYRQEVEPEGIEDFDPLMDLSDEEYDEHLRQEFGESKLRRVIKESVKRILKEDDSTPNIYNNRSMFAKLIHQTMSKMHGINETLFYNVLNGRINQFKILSNEEKDRLVEIAEMANKLNGNITYLSEMLESQSGSQFEHEPEDWHERNEHGDFDTY